MKTEVYSWRLPGDLKSDLERAAQLRKVSVAWILDAAVRDWLKKSGAALESEEAQRKLHDAAERCFGVVQGHDPRRAEKARDAVRERLRRRYAR